MLKLNDRNDIINNIVNKYCIAENGDILMSENVILRTTKMGQKGFVIEDVNQYLDELNDKIVSLEKQLEDANHENENLKKALEGKGVEIPSESKAELAEAKSEIERLKSQLDSNNTTLSVVK